MDILYILPFAFFAGLIDAIAGGGGLIQIPGLLLLFPHVPVATLLGTNKLASGCGTLMSSWHFTRTLKINFKTVIPAMAGAFICAALGAKIATIVDNQLLKPMVFVLLLLIGVYTLCKKNLGLTSQENKYTPIKSAVYYGLIGAGIGFYDGFLGPGTGSFLIICFVGWLGCSFLQGSAYSKLTNLSSNVAATLLFASSNHIIYRLALPMAACNILGNLIGAKLAIKKGSQFVRGVFLVVIIGILLQFMYQMLHPK